MKELSGKFLGNIHWLILIYALYGTYLKYEEHTVAIEGIVSQFAGIEQDTKTTEKSLKEIQENMGKIAEFKTRVESVAKNIEAVQRQLPADINDTQILTYLNQEMSVLNIKDTSVVPSAEQTGTYFVSKDYLFKGKGTFLQFLIFFERLGNADRIYNIKNLKLTNTSDNQKGRFQLVNGESVIQAFRYNPDFKVDLGFDKDTPATVDPAAPPRPPGGNRGGGEE
jgi:Tfp pilus assembly protein PilO